MIDADDPFPTIPVSEEDWRRHRMKIRREIDTYRLWCQATGHELLRPIVWVTSS